MLHTLARIEEVVETHIFEVVEFSEVNKEPEESEDDPIDIFEVFAAERKKREA
jgi:hypothetical protein